MTHKSLFAGKRKLISVPIILGISSIFLPFSVCAVLAFVIAKYINNNIVRIITLVVLAIITMPVGAGWLMGLTGQGAEVDHKQLQQVEGIKTELKEITPASTQTPTPQPTATPEPTATTAPQPTNTPIPTATPYPTKKVIYPTPTKKPVIIPTNTPVPVQTQQFVAPPAQSGGGSSGGGYSGGDKDCKDFATQAEAQSYFNGKGGSPSNNVDDLDRDHDGVACENNP